MACAFALAASGVVGLMLMPSHHGVAASTRIGTARVRAPIGIRMSAEPTDSDFASMRVSELKAILKARSVSIDGCFDKSSLVERAETYRDLLLSPPDPPPWAGGDPEEQGPRSGAAASLILLHGFGDSGGGFISSMGGPLIAMDGLRVVFPSAPRVVMGGFPVSSWLDASSQSSGAADPRTMLRAGDSMAKAAVDYVHALIRREVTRGVPADRIVVGGFSQGGLVAMRAALSFADAPLGGCLALSTFFGDDRASVAAANERLRLLVAHGMADTVVPPSEARRTEECLRRVAPHASVRCRVYEGMGHSSCEEEVRDLRAFLSNVVERSTQATHRSAAVRRSTRQDAVAVGASTAEREVGSADRVTVRVTGAPDTAARPEVPLESMSVGELKAWLLKEGISTADCFEKADLLARAEGKI